MVRQINITYDDKNHKEIMDAKKIHGGNWHDFVLDLARMYKKSKEPVDVQIPESEETKTFDIDRFSTKTFSNEEKKIFMESLDKMTTKFGPQVPVEDLRIDVKSRGLSINFEAILQALKRGGDVFEPKEGFIQKV